MAVSHGLQHCEPLAFAMRPADRHIGVLLFATLPMRFRIRWIGLGLLWVFALLVAAVGGIYIRSELILRRSYDEPLVDIPIPTDSASLAEGQRLATLRGCSGGCHGSQIEGHVFVDQPLVGRVVAPSLSVAVREYSTAELVRIIRRGVRPNGRSVLAMPAGSFSLLEDGDLGRIVAYLRSVPPAPGLVRNRRIGPLGRLAFALGQIHPAAEEVRYAASLSPGFPHPGDSTARGAYLARTICSECHGVDLRGGTPGDEPAPDLRIAAGYTLEQFTHLLRTGEALGGRQLQLMGEMCQRRFIHFTDEEIRALHGFLVARARAEPAVAAAPRAGT
jgi:mono/diheme cytochrome c family protein